MGTHTYARLSSRQTTASLPPSCAPVGRALVATRQVDFDDRTFAYFAVDLYVSLRLLPVHDVFCHAGSIVRNRNHYILAGNNFRIGAAIILVEKCIAGFDRELAAVGHGVASVYGKVEQSGAELVGVDLHRPHAGAAHGLNLDCLSQ